MERPVVHIHGNEWKLSDIQEDIDWCRSQTWSSRKYTANGDHSHCSICWWSLTVSDDPAIGQGFINRSDRPVWICTECHEKFIAGVVGDGA